MPSPSLDSALDMRVSELIDFERGCWDVEVVKATFIEEEWDLILDIPLSWSWPNDRRFWWPNADSKYSVKSWYWLGRLGIHQTRELFHGTSETKIWQQVWNIEGPSKLKHFVWRACKGSLPIRERLHHRHV